VERRVGFASDFRYGARFKLRRARLTLAQLARVSRDPDVAFVSPNRVLHAIGTVPIRAGDTAPPGVRRIGAEPRPPCVEARPRTSRSSIRAWISRPRSECGERKDCIGSGTARDATVRDARRGSIARRTNVRRSGRRAGALIYAAQVINAQGSGTDAQVSVALLIATRQRSTKVPT